MAIHSAASTAPRAKPAPAARAVLEQDLVAAGVEADHVLADDAARADGGHVEPVLGQRLVGRERGLRLRGRRPRSTKRASTLAVPEGASFFCRWCFSSDVGVVVGEAGDQGRRRARTTW